MSKVHASGAADRAPDRRADEETGRGSPGCTPAPPAGGGAGTGGGTGDRGPAGDRDRDGGSAGDGADRQAGRPRRPHTGRRRNDAARDAILDAAYDLIMDADTGNITIDSIAHAAGVGRQTIYRWWPSKGAVAAEAMARQARSVVPRRETGSFRGDLTAFLTDSFAGLADERLRGGLQRLAAAAQQDEHAAEVLADFTAARRAVLRELLERGSASGDLSPDADIPMLVDMAYGVLWYRLLIGHAPLDDRAARDLAACLLAAGARPGAAH